MIPKAKITTIGTIIKDFFLSCYNKKERINILNNLTGRIATKKMTLVMGPPGSGNKLLLLFEKILFKD